MQRAINKSVKRVRPWHRGGAAVARGLLRVSLILLLLIIVFIAILTASARIGLPFLAAYKPSLEYRLSEYMQSPVSIDELNTRWVRSGPVLRAMGVQLTDPQGRQANFDEVLVDFNVPRSLFARAPVINELTLVGATLAIAYDPDTGLGISGVNQAVGRSIPPIADGQVGESTPVKSVKGFNAVAWLLNASRVGMLDTQLTLQLPDNNNVVIENINIRVENKDDLHQVRMDLSLPPELGDKFEMGIDLSADVEDLATAAGNFYLKAADLNSAGVAQIFNSYGIEHAVLKGLAERGTNAQLELWGELKKGKVQRISGRTAVEQSVDNDPEIDSLFGNLVWDREPSGGWRFVASDVVVGHSGAESVFDEIQFGSKSDGLKPQWVALSTAETELTPILDTMNALVPTAMPSELTAWLQGSSLSSKIRRADVRLSLVNPMESFTLVAQLDDTSWLPFAAHPGGHVPRVDMNIVDGVGSVSLPTQRIAVRTSALPASVLALGDDLLSLDEVSWEARVDLAQQSFVGELSVLHETLKLNIDHALTTAQAETPRFDVSGTFSAGTVLDVKPWLTQPWMPQAPREWLEMALRKGNVSNGSFEVSGTLAELTNLKGAEPGASVVKAEFDVSDFTLRYWENWPDATELVGRVVFDHTGLRTKFESGMVEELPVDTAEVFIADLASNPTLALSMSSNAPLHDMVEFCSAGPLHAFIGPVIDDSSVNGPARVEVTVVSPLTRPDGFVKGESVWPVQVRGNVFLTDSDITLSALEDLPLTNVRGAIGFNENGVELRTVEALLFGAKVRLNAATVGEGRERRTDVAVRTVLAGQKLLEQFDLPVAQFVTGSSSWRADAMIPHDPQRLARDGISLTVVSDMIGTRVSLADPFGKSSNQELPLRVSTRFRASTGTIKNPQIWRLTFGDRADPETDILIATAKGDGMQGLAIKLSESLGEEQPPDGIRISGRTDVVSLDGLIEDVAKIIEAIPKPDGPPKPILPISVDVIGHQMSAGNTRIGGVSLKINTDDNYINFLINNLHLKGSLRYPREHWRRDVDIKARINYADKFLIDALASGADETNEPVQRLDPTTLPPVDIHVNAFHWSSMQLSNLRIYAEPDLAGMKIVTFGFATGVTQLIGDGYWHLVDPQNVNPTLANAQTAQLNLTLQSSNFGEAMADLGFPGVVAKGEGRVTASLNWPDAIYAPSLEVLGGYADLEMKRGQLLQIEPGAARFFGLFALQTLPRRFNLDFSDLVSEGLDFDTITGNIAIDSGIADMRLVQLNGPVGVIDITGTTDLVAEEFDQRVSILPRVSAALPIIGVITGGATAGIGALIAGGVLKAAGVDFDRIGLKRFSLTGAWDNPQFKPLSR